MVDFWLVIVAGVEDHRLVALVTREVRNIGVGSQGPGDLLSVPDTLSLGSPDVFRILSLLWDLLSRFFRQRTVFSRPLGMSSMGNNSGEQHSSDLFPRLSTQHLPVAHF